MTQNKNKPSIWHVFQGGSLTDTPSTDLCLSGHILTGHPFTSQLLHFLHLLSARVAPHSIHLNGGTCHRGPQSTRDQSQDVLGRCKIFCRCIPVSLSCGVTRSGPHNSSANTPPDSNIERKYLRWKWSSLLHSVSLLYDIVSREAARQTLVCPSLFRTRVQHYVPDWILDYQAAQLLSLLVSLSQDWHLELVVYFTKLVI